MFGPINVIISLKLFERGSSRSPGYVMADFELLILLPRVPCAGILGMHRYVCVFN